MFHFVLLPVHELLLAAAASKEIPSIVRLGVDPAKQSFAGTIGAAAITVTMQSETTCDLALLIKNNLFSLTKSNKQVITCNDT